MLSKCTQCTRCATIAHTGPYLWSVLRYGRALGTFGEHRRYLNAPKCIEIHLGAFGERLMLSKCTQCPTIAYTDYKYGPYALW